MLCIVEMDIGLGEMEEPQQQLFDCCICSQCTPSTNERLVGLVTLLQPSNGMLHLAHVLCLGIMSVIACTFINFDVISYLLYTGETLAFHYVSNDKFEILSLLSNTV